MYWQNTYVLQDPEQMLLKIEILFSKMKTRYPELLGDR